MTTEDFVKSQLRNLKRNIATGIDNLLNLSTPLPKLLHLMLQEFST
jgi:hypothetical protein